MTTPTRWHRLLESKPIPLMRHFVAEVAKLLAKDLAVWPPRDIELDPQSGAGFAEVIGPDAPRPSPILYREAFRLTRWELERNVEAYDEYIRNRRWLEYGLTLDDRRTLLFISRWLLEQTLALAEATEGRMNRALLVECMELTERRLNELRSSVM